MTPSASAAPEEPTPIEFSAPPSCVDATTFRSRLAGLAPLRERPELPRAITIRITETTGAGFVGEAVVQRQDGRTSTRQVSSERCAEVSDALELITALALGLEEPPPQPAVPTAPATAPVTPVKALATAPDESVTSLPHWRLLVAARGAILSGVGPKAEPGAEVSVGVVRDDTRGWWAPSLELSGIVATSADESIPFGTSKMTLAGGATILCPVRLGLGAGLALRPCVDVQVAALRATAQGATIQSAAAQVEPWIAIAPIARVEWAAGSRVALQIEGGPNLCLDRARFFLTPSNARVYEVPSVGVLAKLGLVLFFP